MQAIKLEEGQSVIDAWSHATDEISSWDSQTSAPTIVLNASLASVVEKLVEEKVEEILKRKIGIKFREVSDAVAKKEISDLFITKLAQGITRIDVLDVVMSLNLPGTQVEKIFNDFIKGNYVKEL